MRQTTQILLHSVTFALALLCVSVPSAHAEGQPSPDDYGNLALASLLVTGGIVVGAVDLGFALSEHSLVPPDWAVVELLVSASWVGMAVSFASPSSQLWLLVFAGAMCAHGVTSLIVYDYPEPTQDAASRQQRRTPSRWGVVPGVNKQGVSLLAWGML